MVPLSEVDFKPWWPSIDASDTRVWNSPGVPTGEVSRSGPFWDTIEGRRAAPPAAATLGWRLSQVAPERGEIEVNFTASGMGLS